MELKKSGANRKEVGKGAKERNRGKKAKDVKAGRTSMKEERMPRKDVDE